MSPRQVGPEAGFQAGVLELMALTGWRVVHFTTSWVRGRGGAMRPVTAYQGNGGPGFPDLVAWRERLIMAELKAKGGRVSEEQRARHRELRAAGVELYVWTPRDWPEIEAVLAPASDRAE